MRRLLVIVALLAVAAPAARAIAQAPAVQRPSTGGAQSVTTTTAVLRGSVDPRGLPTTVYFVYGPTRAYGARTPDIAVGAGTARVAVSAPVAGLTPDTRYHYRLVVAGGAATGRDRSFRTRVLGPQPSKLALGRATISASERLIDVFAPISRRASGTVAMQLRAAGRTHRWEAAVNSSAGWIRDLERIAPQQAALRTGILTMSYPGDRDTRPQVVRLRAADVPARLSAARPTLVAGRLRAAGAISGAARGVVRVQLEYFSGGRTTTLERHAAIAGGRWSLDAALSAQEQLAIAQRRGVVHSYILFTGYLPERMRGEMRSYQVLPEP